jgi:hypothetical protein
MKKLMLTSAILIGLGAAAEAREIFLLCHLDGASHPGFNIAVDLERSTLTVDDQLRSSHYEAKITPDYIEYNAGMFSTRIDRKSGDWAAWSYTGSAAKGSCQQTDDQRRLDQNICCYVKPNPALCSADGC